MRNRPREKLFAYQRQGIGDDFHGNSFCCPHAENGFSFLSFKSTTTSLVGRERGALITNSAQEREFDFS